MANLISKIDRLGLDKLVQELMAEGIIVGRQIAEILREEHDVKISDSAVCRYVAKIKKEVEHDAAATFRDHINREIPKDLESLENIQEQANAWWKEEPADISRRLASKYSKIDEIVDPFLDRLMNADLSDEKERRRVVKYIFKTCSDFLDEETRLQKKRIQAMKMELDAIKIKLANSGALDTEERGNIIIVDKREQFRRTLAAKDGRTKFKIVTGEPEGTNG